MADPDGFLKHQRREAEHRPVHLRVRDWGEMYEPVDLATLRDQASRCMDCAIPFCNSLSGCPLGNLIPDWNDLVYRDRWRDAIDRLHATNNFPEFTGRMCPAPCESACVLSINDDPVTIKQVENEIIDYAWEHGWVTPVRPSSKTTKRVAVVGSGPAGMAAAQQLTRAGHGVVVYERDDRPGGLIRYGIPDFKMDKALLDRRVTQMEAEGTVFECGVDVGVDLSVEDLRSSYDAVVLAIGALWQRELDIPGRHLRGVHLAMEYLVPSNRVQAGLLDRPPIDAAGKSVIIIGGGDTGADCLGTAHRQGASSVHQFDIHEQPPDERPESTPWPLWPLVLRGSLAHEEGGKRVFAVQTDAFMGDESGHVRALLAHQVRELGRRNYEDVPGSEFELAADLVLLAIGFRGPDGQLLDKLGTELTERGNVAHDGSWGTTVPGVFACGDATRGASLIVWAIAEGRAAAASVDRYLVGETLLPAALATFRRLVDLATHTSGYPRIPRGVKARMLLRLRDPYALVRDRDVDRSLRRLSRNLGPGPHPFEYSNFGYGVLSRALAAAGEQPFGELLRQEVLRPLNLEDVNLETDTDPDRRRLFGHNGSGSEMEHCHNPALQGAGFLFSSIEGMRRYLAANLFPETTSLRVPLDLVHQARYPAGPGMQVGLGWFVRARDEGPVYWHNGGTAGFGRFIGFDLERQLGVAVLMSRVHTPRLDEAAMTVISDLRQ